MSEITGGTGSSFALIVVLFILLIIIGASFIGYDRGGGDYGGGCGCGYGGGGY